MQALDREPLRSATPAERARWVRRLREVRDRDAPPYEGTPRAEKRARIRGHTLIRCASNKSRARKKGWYVG